MNRSLTCAAAAIALIVGHAPAAFAQAPPSPLTLEPIPTQLVVAPDYKVTDLDGDFAQLAGAYAGTMIDNTMFVGGAAYWLADGPDDAKLTYGGVLLGWNSSGASRIRFGARALTGLGTARLPLEISPRLPRDVAPLAIRFGRMMPPAPGSRTIASLVRPIRVRVADDFFVFEPQATLGLGVFDHVTVNVAAGYRATAFADALRDRLHGPTGSLGVEFDW